MVDESSATELGKLLGVKVIITGSVMKLQDTISVSARIAGPMKGSSGSCSPSTASISESTLCEILKPFSAGAASGAALIV